MKTIFSRLSAAAVFDKRLSAEAKVVLAAISCYADEKGYCFPAVTTIAAQLGINRRNVQRNVRKLEDAGYIDREPTLRATKGGWGRNRYWLRYPRAATGDIVIGKEPDAARDAASTSEPASNLLANNGTTRRLDTTDAAWDAATDAARDAAQTEHRTITTEKESNGRAHVHSHRDGMIQYGDGSWKPDPDEPGPSPAPLAQQWTSPTRAPSLNWAIPKRPPTPTDHTTEMAGQLSVLPGFDRKLAWEAILCLPDEAMTRLERGDLHITELLGALRDLDFEGSGEWQRTQGGLAAVRAAGHAE